MSLSDLSCWRCDVDLWHQCVQNVMMCHNVWYMFLLSRHVILIIYWFMFCGSGKSFQVLPNAWPWWMTLKCKVTLSCTWPYLSELLHTEFVYVSNVFIIIRGEPHGRVLAFLHPAANGLYLVPFSVAFGPRFRGSWSDVITQPGLARTSQRATWPNGWSLLLWTISETRICSALW